MRAIEQITDLKAIIRSYKKTDKSIGFVPTMGYLHKGHTSLIKNSKHDNDITILSIFVNPAQFGPGEDFESYPKDLQNDLQIAEKAGVDVVFIPNAEDLYPNNFKTYVDMKDLPKKLCGKSRPDHFKGVLTIVTKLFNIVEPHKVYFGQKDAQQVIIINKLIKDLNMNIELIVCPTVRETDGLAMSSRNVNLNPAERKKAAILSQSLLEIESLIKNGEKDAKKLHDHIVNNINSVDIAVIDYIEIVSADNLEPIVTLYGKVLIALAVKFGKARLIDNIIIEV